MNNTVSFFALLASNPYSLDLEAFRTFLLGFPPETEVGKTCDDADCPLARFLNACYEGSTFLVNLTDYRRVMDDISLGVEPDVVFSLPLWARWFVFAADASGGFVEGVPIDAQQALALLQVASSERNEVSWPVWSGALCQEVPQ